MNDEYITPVSFDKLIITQKRANDVMIMQKKCENENLVINSR